NENRCMMATCARSKYETALQQEAREGMNRRIKIRPVGDNPIILDEEMSAGCIAAAQNCHEASALPQLVQQCVRDIFDTALKNDQVIRPLGCMACFKIANLNGGVTAIKLGQCRGRRGCKICIGLKADNEACNAGDDSRRIA